jgi:DNA-binding CsgD family transcriptional regulator
VIGESIDGTILVCNDAAIDLLGHTPRETVGRDFAQVFRPRDIYGNPLRYDGAFFLGLLSRGRPLRNFECNLRKVGGDYQRCTVSMVTVLGTTPIGHQFVYILWPVLRRRLADDVIERVLTRPELENGRLGESLRRDAAAHHSPLTPRQLEVLRLVAEGRSTHQIAETLCISVETVRHHVRNVLERLDAHSRAEAVSSALRRHLI